MAREQCVRFTEWTLFEANLYSQITCIGRAFQDAPRIGDTCMCRGAWSGFPQARGRM
jgi:hypothetical protein